MIKGANPQAPPLDVKWQNYLRSRDDMIQFLIDQHAYSNYKISLTMSLFIDTVNYIVANLDEKPGGGPNEIAKIEGHNA